MSIKRKIIYILILFLFSSTLFAQNDSIIKLVSKEQDTLKKIDLLLVNSENKMQQNPSLAIFYAQNAMKLSVLSKNEIKKSKALYLIGKTYLLHNMYIKALNFFNKSIKIQVKYFDELKKDSSYLKNFASVYYNAANIYQQMGFLDSAISYNSKALILNNLVKDKEGSAYAYFSLANNYLQKGNYNTVGLYLDSASHLFSEIKVNKGLSYCWNSYGNLYRMQGNYPKALGFYLKSKQINEDTKDLRGLATANNNIAIVHKFQGDYKEALFNFKGSLKIRQKLQDTPGLAESYNNIAGTFFEMSKKQKAYLDSALNYYSTCISYSEQTNNRKLLAVAYYNIGGIYLSKNKADSSLIYLDKAKKIVYVGGNMRMYAQVLLTLGDLMNKNKDYNKASDFLSEALNVSKNINAKELIRDIYYLQSETSYSKKNFKKAFLQLIDYQKMSDSLKNEENTKKIARLSIRYEFEQKQKELEFQKKQSEIKAEAELKHQKMLRNIFLMGFGFVALLALVIFKNFKRKQRDNEILTQQKLEIEKQRDEIQHKSNLISNQNLELEKKKQEIEVQRDEIQEKNQSILDSINYASRIQRAILPNLQRLANFFDDSFILYRPRDIVSGDFYWSKEFEEKIILVGADCTGHGVPAAIMSMLGVALLNQIVGENREIKANEILTELRKKVISTLHQQGGDSETKDGMDMSLLIFDRQKKKIEFSGAHNPLYLLRNDEINIYKADKMPIGITFRRDKDFSLHEIDYQDGDICYIFSDGYVDQFGGPDNRKFLSKRFRKLLLEINKKPLDEQLEHLNQSFDNWKGSYEQIDDILVIGVKI